MAPVTLSWPRQAAATTITKSPVFQAILTETATGYIVDIVVDTTDPDFTADTIVMRHVHVFSVVDGKLVDNVTTYKFGGNTAYTSSTNPANTAGVEGTTTNVKVGESIPLDTFWTAGGFARTNPT